MANDRLSCCTSSWRRVDDTMMPARVKSTAIYLNSVLAKTEATINGFDEAILLNHDGHVSEGAAENVFMVKDGRIFTPVLEDNALGGITRDTVMHLSRVELEMDVEMRTNSIDRKRTLLGGRSFPLRNRRSSDKVPVVRSWSRQKVWGLRW